MRWLPLILVPTLAVAQPAFPPAEWVETDPDRVELGWLLFYDPVLSGNQEVACATCHHPRFGTSDAVSLSIGDGGIGLGPDRRFDPENMPEQRIPRNAPALFNLGASEFTVMFHDGRLEADPTRPNGIRTPLGDSMAERFDSVLAAQGMFPVLSADEMAGHYSENPISRAVRMGHLSLEGGAWDQIAARVAEIPDYRARFDAILGEGEEITFAEIGNVLAEFTRYEWRADDSPFDRYLADDGPISDAAARGMEVFYQVAGCGSCHAGRFQTDHDFHAIAMPQLGPGKATRFETHARDEGRMHVTGDPGDAFAFRTPSLRNVALTAPYGHSGAYPDLESVIRHHLDPVNSLMSYDPSLAILPDFPGVEDWRVLTDAAEMLAIATANELSPITLEDQDIADLIAFLETLTDPISVVGRLGVPDSVPSGLSVPR